MLTLDEQVRNCLATPEVERHMGWKFDAMYLLHQVEKKVTELDGNEQFLALWKMYRYHKAELKLAIHEFNELEQLTYRA